jgi:hypothetical protein
MRGDLSFDHGSLALENNGHVDRGGIDRPAELRTVMDKMGDPRTRYLIFAWHAGDVGTGAAYPPVLYDGGSPSGLRHGPGY